MDLLTAEELAKELKVSMSWIRDHASGRRKPFLPAINISTEGHPQYRFSKTEIQTWLNQLANKR